MNQKKSNSPPKPYPEGDSAPKPIGKVAETASVAYGMRTDTKWKPPPARTIAGLAADDEVWSFVRANGLLPHLETAIQLARRTFSDLREIRLTYDPDPELPFFNCVTINAKAKGTVEEVFAQDQNYTSVFVETIPAEKRHQITLHVGIA